MIPDIVLLAATLLCSLVAGFLFAFAVVVMPGIGRMQDGDFLRAFQEIDGVIQRGQPLFGLVWLGSVIALLAGVGLAFGSVSGLDRALLVAAGGVYLLGVQLPTFWVNIPLNKRLQALDVTALSNEERSTARERFESAWNRANRVRTVLAVVVSALLLVVLLGL